jgi:anaerobic selenocysteine-containing dehydrogenase
MKHQIRLTVNGESRDVSVETTQTLLDVLRDHFKFIRTKEGCGIGECGACAVSLDKKIVPACMVLALDADNKHVITMEGLQASQFGPVTASLMNPQEGALHASCSAPGTKSRRQVFSFCHVCPGHCSISVIVEDGKVVDIEPDLESGLPSEQCPVKKGRFTIPEVLYHRNRLIHPLKRIGVKGEGRWQRISWDEALDTIATKLQTIKDRFGPEAVALGLGEPKGMEFAFGQRFASAFGTPTVVTPAWFCGVATLQSQVATYGWSSVPDDDNQPELMVFWGCNNNHTSGGIRRETTGSFLDKGTKIIVIDPQKIDLAKVADLWIRIKPGSDGALAMGLLKVVVEEKYYDEETVSKWTVGFEKLKAHLKTFTLAHVEKETWVPRHQIETFARQYSRAEPGVIQWGNAIDMQANGFQTGRAISILRAICGNLNIRGGDVRMTPGSFLRFGRFYLLNKYPRKTEQILGDRFKLTQRMALIPSHSLIEAILKEKPFPVKAAMFILTNPLLSYPDSKKTYEALMKLDFTVVHELFMTPTAALADIVLPAAWGMESDELGYWPGWYEELRVHPKIVDPPGECWPDTKIVNELAKRLGLEKEFWEDDEESLDDMLAPMGMTFDQLKAGKRTLLPEKQYKRHDFKTPSGKIEIYSSTLDKMGIIPMPLWEEIISKMPQPSQAYPFLMTNGKEEVFMGSSYYHVASIRRMRPNPVVEMNPDSAREMGFKEGDWILIETKDGACRQKLHFNKAIDPRVIIATFGSWFPEQADDLFGWQRANLNMVTPNGPEYDPTTGAVTLRGVPCRVAKLENYEGDYYVC